MMTHWTERHFRGECQKLWGLEEQLAGKRVREGHRIPHRRMGLEKSRNEEAGKRKNIHMEAQKDREQRN